MHKLYPSTRGYLIQSILVSAHQNPRVRYMTDSRFAFAIPSNTIVFGLDFRRFVAAEHFSLPPLQQVEVLSIWIRKWKFSRLELTTINSIKNAMRTTSQANNLWNHTMRLDIAPKTCFKWFAELEEFPLHLWNLIENIHTNWVLFSLGIIRFVVQQDQIRCRHRTLSITAPATSTSLKSEHTETSSRKWKFSWLQLTRIKLRFYSITMRTICHAHKFVKEASATSLTSHEILLFAGPRILINSTSIRPFHYLHYDGMCLTTLPDIAHRVMCLTIGHIKAWFVILLCMM